MIIYFIVFVIGGFLIGYGTKDKFLSLIMIIIFSIIQADASDNILYGIAAGGEMSFGHLLYLIYDDHTYKA